MKTCVLVLTSYYCVYYSNIQNAEGSKILKECIYRRTKCVSPKPPLFFLLLLFFEFGTLAFIRNLTNYNCAVVLQADCFIVVLLDQASKR